MPMRGWILYVHNVARPLARPWTGREWVESEKVCRGGGVREKERAESSRSGALDILNFHLGHDHLGARSLSVR